jgi:hypothetical protein
VFFNHFLAVQFIRHIIMPDMYQAASFARQGMLNSHLGPTAIAGGGHIQW